ncbi:MAG TPA: tetratricopeptide repeat protein [Reyranella sp.]|nr:tetratricopeptide repeat protein [Reyranella sp.]
MGGAPAIAGALEDGRAAYDRGDYAAALAAWKPLAEHGDVDAEFWMGALYDLGRGVPRDLAAAVVWYRRAAEHGSAMAQYNLAHMYEQGEGVSPEYAMAAAVAWYRRAANQGYTYAQGNLGALYATGRGVRRDDVQAYKWFTLAGVAKNRDFVAARMTAEQIAAAESEIKAWKAKPER